jgi:DNA polymerase-3 subunit epsilon
MREIVLDTETTGVAPEEGHRLIEIGCVELINHVPTGRTLQIYLNPERSIPADATAIHGITDSFVRDKPVFSQIYHDFLEFIDESILIIHNAEFDLKFLNAELRKVGHPPLSAKRVVDTLMLARRKFPGSPANLDALCRRFGIDNTGRVFHGALLDCELLAEVYLELLGGRQHGLGLSAETSQSAIPDKNTGMNRQKETSRPFRPARTFTLSEAERTAHQGMIERLPNAIWTHKS